MEAAIRPAMPVGWSRYIIPMNDGRFFVPYWMIETTKSELHLSSINCAGRRITMMS